MKELFYNKAIYGEPEKQAVRRVLDSEWLSGHKETYLFEKELATWWGRKYAVSCNSGSSANLIAMQSLALERGSEVITPAGAAFPTTLSPIIFSGLKPHLVDVGEDLCVNVDNVDGSKASAIVFAHTLGNMPDMGKVMDFAGRYNLRVLEDTCDAMGSKQDGKKAGTFGDLATVSFYPAHHMTTGGEGGAILMDDFDLYHACRSIRDWGRDCKCVPFQARIPCGDRFSSPPFDHRYYYTRMGFNLKLTEMQAAFGREQLKRVDGFIETRRRNYEILTGQRTELSPFAHIVMHPDKNRVMAELQAKGIHTRGLFTGNILEHPAFKDMDCVKEDLPVSERIHREGFFVGLGPHLTEDDMLYIKEELCSLTK